MNDLRLRLQELGLVLPPAPPPSASYMPWMIEDSLLYVSGQVPKDPNGAERYIGKLGIEFDIPQGQAAARLCALNVLAQVDSAVEHRFDRVRRCLRLGGFVNSAVDFYDHPSVINGASELLMQVMGDQGRHARTAVGVVSLPRNVAVEVDAIFALT